MRWLQSLHTQWTLHLVMQGEERRRKRRMVLQTSASVNRFLLLNSIPPHDKEEQQHHQKTEDGNTEHRALKSFHNRSKYYKPLHGYNNKTKHSGRFTLGEDDRGISIGNNGVSYRISADAPFEFQFSYSETPKVKPLALREPPYVPFGPTTMPRPWTGGPPLTKKKKNLPGFGSNLNTPRKEVEQAPQHGPTPTRTQILGHPLTKKEVDELLQSCCHTNRQVNLGRDGLTHNMLELVHEHWRRRSVCKIKCKGVPTVDMDNVCYHLEEKTGGKIIHRAGGVVYLFRGRNYNHKTRPRFPLMLWKPAAPIYPKLIERAPGGLTKEQADKFRKKGRHLLSICKLAKNGVYVTLVNDVREAFEENELVRINCEGMNPSDYKKIGAKLKDLVPCVLLSFDKEHILMWRGKDWKSKNADQPSAASTQEMEMM